MEYIHSLLGELDQYSWLPEELILLLDNYILINSVHVRVDCSTFVKKIVSGDDNIIWRLEATKFFFVSQKSQERYAYQWNSNKLTVLVNATPNWIDYENSSITIGQCIEDLNLMLNICKQLSHNQTITIIKPFCIPSA